VRPGRPARTGHGRSCVLRRVVPARAQRRSRDDVDTAKLAAAREGARHGSRFSPDATSPYEMSVANASEAKFAPPLPHPRYPLEWYRRMARGPLPCSNHRRGLAPVGRGRDISAGDPRDEAAYHGQGQIVHAFLLSPRFGRIAWYQSPSACRRPGSRWMTSNTLSPKARTSFFA
jgi:hypothetical protein